MTKRKLTKSDERAQALCQSILDIGEREIVVEWTRGGIYGKQAYVETWDGKAGLTGGCGYCKLSTALADVLRWLFEPDTEDHNAIWRTGGAGEQSVKRELAKRGWSLEKTSSGKNHDAYRIRRVSE